MFFTKTGLNIRVKIFLLRAAVIFTILFAVAAVYSNAVHTSFQLDDQHMIENNERIKNVENYLDSSKWLTPKFNRVLPQLSLSVNFHFHGYEVEGYHITNIVIHALNSIIVYFLIILLFKFESVKRERISEYSELIAFFSAIIFAVHPMQMQAVTYISQRLASIATLFYLLGTFAYVKARLLRIQENRKAFSVLFYALVFVCFYFGMHSKQNIATLPLAIFAVEIFFVRNKNGKIFHKYILTFLIVSVIATLSFIVFIEIPHAYGAPDADIYLATQFRAYPVYISKLFIPVSLKLFYNLPFSASLLGMREIAGFLFILGIIFAAVILFKRARLLSFGIAWFFITMLIESSVFPLKYSFFEYRVYPGMFGYSLFISSFFFYIKKIKPKAIVSLLTLAVIAYANATVQINKTWRDGISLWKDNVEKTTNYADPYANLATYYVKENLNDSALVYFNRAIVLDSTLSFAYLNRGTIYLKNGDLRKALDDLNKAVNFDSNSSLAFNNRGFLYLQLRKPQKAIDDFMRAIEITPEYHYALSNLCIAYNSIGEYKKAFEVINKAIKLNGDNPNYYNNRGNLHFSIGDYHVAAANYLKALSLAESDYKAMNNFAIAQRALKIFDKSISYSSKALEIDPYFIPAYLNRAFAELALGRETEAVADIESALEINPNNYQAILLRKIILGQKGEEIDLSPEFIYKTEIDASVKKRK